jgi:hypothetical protein
MLNPSLFSVEKEIRIFNMQLWIADKGIVLQFGGMLRNKRSYRVSGFDISCGIWNMEVMCNLQECGLFLTYSSEAYMCESRRMLDR